MTLATNATHKDFNKPTDSRMVAMPMAIIISQRSNFLIFLVISFIRSTSRLLDI